ncbi:Malate/lactate/ureidoglycolate dehydrogenase, LDH2 family [Friedmanniella luteola]|uniref:Malate/lactate/ureidoglycolate dehydrogenase, LDH2 family n=1 Tax=Friedmanniella luteola TaxID=546871 RepID=A0A1H1Z731_9ACTN|nr:Ldh family oxidoreductase [Friedmanniella luteola]SDT29433.1 Malate/lactate/ureidoglycolate dehydrogenase, LDH2 family [Friedmanniella luteola]
MNIPPEAFVRVEAAAMERFAAELGVAAGMPAQRATLLAELLTANDLRGVLSHGTQQLATYVRLVRDGSLNPAPEPAVVRETANSLLVDGDGGLGYFAAAEGTRRLLDKVADSDVAVLVTRQHGHFGAAGLYARMTLGHDVLCFVTSGHQLDLRPGDPVHSAAGGSPMAFTAPTGEEDPLVLDFGAMHDLYADSPHRDEIARLAPGLVHRAIGLGAVCQAWGGLLAGVPLDPVRAERRWPGANQGSMVVLLKIALFAEPEHFRAEMDAYVRAVWTLRPVTAGQGTYLPGGIEAERERAARAAGIPVGEEHRALLGAAAAELGVAAPW